MNTTCSTNDLAILSELIDRIYQGATCLNVWNDLLPDIARWVHAPYGLLFTPMHAPANGGFYFNHAIPESVMQLWSTRYQPHDVMTQTAVAKGLFQDGLIGLSQDVIPFEEYKQSLIYRELNQPNGIAHMLFCSVFGFQSPSGMPPTVLSFYRSEDVGVFDKGEADRLQLLMPHVSRALAVMSKLRDAELRIAASHAALDRISSGILLFGADGSVTFANLAAQRILQAEDGLLLQPRMGNTSLGMLMADDVQAHALLGRAIRNAVSPDVLHTAHYAQAITLARPSGRQAYALNFSSLATTNEFGTGPDAPQAIAFITDNSEPVKLDAQLMKRTYGLTSAEIRCAEMIAEGLTLEAVAEQFGISRNTAKTQLQSVYEKTGTNNRPKLMKLIMSLATVSA